MFSTMFRSHYTRSTVYEASYEIAEVPIWSLELPKDIIYLWNKVNAHDMMNAVGPVNIEISTAPVVVKDNCNPVFDETFEYVLSQGEIGSKQLEVTVGTQKQLFYSSSNILGQVIIDLGKLNLTQPYNMWFDLQPEAV